MLARSFTVGKPPVNEYELVEVAMYVFNIVPNLAANASLGTVPTTLVRPSVRSNSVAPVMRFLVSEGCSIGRPPVA